MDAMTPRRAVELVDALLPNQYDEAQKLAWVYEAEGHVLALLGRETGELAEDTALTVPQPWDPLYRHYTEAQIHYCNGEMERYNNAMDLWNALLLTWRDYTVRSGGGSVAALKLC